MKIKILFVAATSLIVLILFFNRGFAYYDEGFILHAAQRVAEGEIAYKSFDFIYTPGAIFLLAAVFKLFGDSILVGRILILVVGALTATFIYYICFKLCKNKLISFLSLLIYLSWGPSHINFPWPSLFAFSSGLLATYLTGINPVFSGVFVVVTGLLKQNFGVAVLLSSLLSLILIKKYRKSNSLISFGLGILFASVFFLVYLLLTKSVTEFFNNIFLYTIKGVLIDKAFATGFPVGLKSLIYILPGMISLLALMIAFKQQSKSIVFPLFTLFFYLFGIRPTTDYPHLVVLMAGVGIALTIVRNSKLEDLNPKQIRNNNYQNTKQHSLKNLKIRILKIVSDFGFRISDLIIISLAILIIIPGFYTALFRNYYKWDSPLVKQNYFISHPRAGIFVDQKFSTVIPEITNFVEQNSKKGDYIFVFYNAPMFYFLTDRKNPTRYVNFSPDLSFGEKREKEVIKNLKAKKVRIIITHEPSNKWGNPIITDFILANFEKKKEIFEFGLWERVN